MGRALKALSILAAFAAVSFLLLKPNNIYLEVYYPGSLEYLGYKHGSFEFELVERSDEINIITVKDRIWTLIDEDLKNNPMYVRVNGDKFRAVLRFWHELPIKGEDLIYIASPYNFTELAVVHLPENYTLKGWEFEKGALILEIEPADRNEGRVIIHNEKLREVQAKIKYQYAPVFYTYRGRIIARGEVHERVPGVPLYIYPGEITQGIFPQHDLYDLINVKNILLSHYEVRLKQNETITVEGRILPAPWKFNYTRGVNAGKVRLEAYCGPDREEWEWSYLRRSLYEPEGLKIQITPEVFEIPVNGSAEFKVQITAEKDSLFCPLFIIAFADEGWKSWERVRIIVGG
ncbi:hypothetical protein [Thermococcus barophilus]|uniref:Uncharacterized protein n=1 Tax=Thermococcus barophilus (strain DSM 11836 / MP) TaxID=391623 RepID=F0LMV0_THEBM|nr:hypothetical protein [Thermococcus barophilus]ADT84079.1 hypothetical protein TERMP_01103 [Thermococcus barophilus MP]